MPLVEIANLEVHVQVHVQLDRGELRNGAFGIVVSAQTHPLLDLPRRGKPFPGPDRTPMALRQLHDRVVHLDVLLVSILAPRVVREDGCAFVHVDFEHPAHACEVRTVSLRAVLGTRLHQRDAVPDGSSTQKV